MENICIFPKVDRGWQIYFVNVTVTVLWHARARHTVQYALNMSAYALSFQLTLARLQLWPADSRGAPAGRSARRLST